MRFVDSRCIHCGATLRVAADATHVCCQYCNSELHIIHDGDRATTELVREMHEGLSQKLDVLRVQNEIERLDREWNMERENYTVPENGGGRSVPTVFGSALVVIVAVVVGIAMLTMTSMAGMPPLFVGVGVLMLGAIIFSAWIGITKANAYDSAEVRYQAARQRLMRELARVQQPVAPRARS